MIMSNNYKLYSILLLLLILVPVSIRAECTCDSSDTEDRNEAEALRYKLVAIASILVAGAIGVCIPLLGRIVRALHPENDVFFVIKAFAAGVILATGFIHVLPDAFKSLTCPCLGGVWGDFPFSGLVAMAAAIGAMMVDTVTTSYFKRSQPLNSHCNGDLEKQQQQEQGSGTLHIHTHATPGHAHGSASSENSGSSHDQLRHRIISQVLELGIVVHSVIIGISLGASMSPKTIKPLVAALTFHQFFEGMGLGSCISQAKFKARTIATMSIFFTLTTPVGIVIGFGISNIYDESSPTALIAEGIFNSASAGILIYMALVDLLAADFMNSRLQNNLKLHLGAYLSLLFGAGFMSLLAKWA